MWPEELKYKRYTEEYTNYMFGPNELKKPQKLNKLLVKMGDTTILFEVPMGEDDILPLIDDPTTLLPNNKICHLWL
jgi:hypothetical protein